jgi:hypothetical protein
MQESVWSMGMMWTHAWTHEWEYLPRKYATNRVDIQWYDIGMISIVIWDNILSIDETFLNGFTSRSNDAMDCDDTDEESC